MTCPFQEEEKLSSIIDKQVELVQEISIQVNAFKTTLTDEQLRGFNAIDDLMQRQITRVQRETIIEIHCPNCRKKDTCK